MVLHRADDTSDHFGANPFERVLVDFEEACKQEKAPSIERCLAGWEGEDRVELLRELIWLDMDYRLRYLATCAQASQTTVACGDTPATLDSDAIPRLESYWSRFPELGGRDGMTVECIGEEYAAKLRHASPARMDEYLERFPWHGASLRRHLRRLETKLNRLEPLFRVGVYRYHECLFTAGFCAALVIGRQQLGEPDPFCRHEDEDITRLIVASVEERGISRRHLRCEAENPRQLRLTNVSRKSEVLVGQDSLITPNKSHVVSLPATLWIGELVIRCNTEA